VRMVFETEEVEIIEIEHLRVGERVSQE
jgi:hypothetical protein